jgi:hypothetical protein
MERDRYDFSWSNARNMFQVFDRMNRDDALALCRDTHSAEKITAALNAVAETRDDQGWLFRVDGR